MSKHPIYDTITLHSDCSALNGTRYTELPAQVLDSLPAMLGRVAPMFDNRAGAGVVILTGPAAGWLGLPLLGAGRHTAELESTDHPVLTAPRAAGWKVTGLAPWMTFWAPGRPTIHVAVHPWLDPNTTGPLYDPDVWEMGWHLHRYAELTGTPYHSTPGVAGIGLLRDRWHGQTVPYWTPEPKVPAGCRQAENDIADWTAEAPAAGNYRHSYDANIMYLGAAGAAQCATSELEHTGPGVRPEWKRAGYWRIEPPRLDPKLDQLPSPLGFRRAVHRVDKKPATGRWGELWVSTPTVMLLAELAGRDRPLCSPPVVLDSWTAPGTRVVRAWAQALTAAVGTVRESTDPYDRRQLEALKATYRETIGMLARPTSRVHRPDWRHAVIGMARWSFWRKLLTVAELTERWPTSVNVDCATYAADTRDPVAACPDGITLGNGAGQFKITKTEETTL